MNTEQVIDVLNKLNPGQPVEVDTLTLGYQDPNEFLELMKSHQDYTVENLGIGPFHWRITKANEQSTDDVAKHVLQYCESEGISSDQALERIKANPIVAGVR